MNKRVDSYHMWTLKNRPETKNFFQIALEDCENYENLWLIKTYAWACHQLMISFQTRILLSLEKIVKGTFSDFIIIWKSTNNYFFYELWSLIIKLLKTIVTVKNRITDDNT